MCVKRFYISLFILSEAPRLYFSFIAFGVLGEFSAIEIRREPTRPFMQICRSGTAISTANHSACLFFFRLCVAAPRINLIIQIHTVNNERRILLCFVSFRYISGSHRARSRVNIFSCSACCRLFCVHEHRFVRCNRSAAVFTNWARADNVRRARATSSHRQTVDTTSSACVHGRCVLCRRHCRRAQTAIAIRTTIYSICTHLLIRDSGRNNEC